MGTFLTVGLAGGGLIALLAAFIQRNSNPKMAKSNFVLGVAQCSLLVVGLTLWNTPYFFWAGAPFGALCIYGVYLGRPVEEHERDG